MDNILLITSGVLLLLFSFSMFILIIRSAIDGSNMSKKMDVLIDEIRMLRTEIKNNKHIIDKKI
ncbi:hypothetical protein NSQ90_05820 [Paenibacillus sp. FSL H7-0737]|uniref:hypothetical protein n=1 Tax=Paenibacillus sp. FSL H7-0737 TaxID=1536775 RepID=UPI0004F63C49|nr:hypothetical protein [Paenibacillus sp. FSL H7-0737]AIQ22423.1 hypothetical protein H70737_05915 [Paenibacillus sp. FSL H7-0737]